MKWMAHEDSWGLNDESRTPYISRFTIYVQDSMHGEMKVRSISPKFALSNVSPPQYLVTIYV